MSIYTNLEKFKKEYKLFLFRDTYLVETEKRKLLRLLDKINIKIFRVILLRIFKPNAKILKFDKLYYKSAINTYNKRFIKKRLIKYKKLFDGQQDNLEFGLDDAQRRAVVIDDKYNLLVAAAGSGKTAVITSRIAYLLRRSDKVNPKKLLALAFNTSAAYEMKSRLKNQYDLDVNIKTFHSFGLEILRDSGHTADITSEMEIDLEKIFKNMLRTDVIFRNSVLHYAKKISDTKTFVSLNGIKVRSRYHKMIADFLFLNGINFLYKKRVFKSNNKKFLATFFVKDYNFVIEYYFLNNKKVPDWFDIDIEQYQSIKIRNKNILEDNDIKVLELDLTSNISKDIKDYFESIGVELISKTLEDEDIFKKFYNYNKLGYFCNLIKTFIQHAKSNRSTPEDVTKNINESQNGDKTIIFARIANKVYKQYQIYLNINDLIDYNDMINLAIDQVEENNEYYINKFDQILVDEFQDISKQRLDLIKAFVNNKSDTKLFCVGDDWQSIYRFAGSDVDIFVNFENYFKNPTISYLDNNYRSSELIVKVAGQLISNNKNQRTKKVKALKKISKTSINLKVVKQVLDEEAYMKKECELIYKKINKLLKNNIKASEIMILARFNKPIRLIKSKLETEIDSELLDKLKIMTVHRAKGSQAKYVFIMDMIDGDDGFPSERKDDSVLDFIKPDIVDNGFEEERRLFYVALTRAKEHIYIYTQEGRESMFLGEIEDYLKVG